MKKHMNKYMIRNYTLFGREKKKEDRLTKLLREILKKPVLQYLVFAVLMSVCGYLMSQNILPYSWQSSMSTVFAHSIAAVGFCLLMGYSGLASLGTGGFVGIGAYCVHYIMNEAGLSFFVALIVSILVAALIGLIVGFISLRIEGIYLVILTLALSEIFRSLCVAVETTIDVKKGLHIFGMKIPTTSYMMVASVFLFVIMTITSNLINSPTGRAMLAMKNSTAAAQAMGISLIKYRLMAFTICTIYAAVAGTIWIFFDRGIDSSLGTGPMSLSTSLNILGAVIIGGYKSIFGAVIGSFMLCGGFELVVLNNDVVKTLLGTILPIDIVPDIIGILQGILVIIIVMFYPGGLAQLLVELKTKLKALGKKMKEAKYGKDLG